MTLGFGEAFLKSRELLEKIETASNGGVSTRVDLSFLIEGNGEYDSGALYDLFRKRQPSVTWGYLIWRGVQCKRWSMITWMAGLIRLPLSSTLLSWGLVSDDTCAFSGRASKTNDHLWFTCSFTSAVVGCC